MIHSPEALSGPELQARAVRAGFSEAGARSAYALAWDFEIYAQLQSNLSQLRLKGGGATQLYVPRAWQRGSVDIDVLTSVTRDAMAKSLDAISQVLADDTFFKFELYIPKDPRRDLPLETYLTSVPAMDNDRGSWQIKVDVHYTEDLPEPAQPQVHPFIIELRFNPLIVSRSYLVADKRLSLAIGTIGIDIAKRPDDVAKQIFDTTALTLNELHAQDVDEIRTVTPALVRAQGPRWSSADAAQEVLVNLRESLFRLSVVDLTEDRKWMKPGAQRFCELHLTQEFRKQPLYWWATKSARCLFLDSLLQSDMGAERIVDTWASAAALVARIGHGDQSVRDKAFDMLPQNIRREFRGLRGAPTERVIWVTLSSSPFEDVATSLNGS